MLSFFCAKNSTIVRAFINLDWLPPFTLTITDEELMADLHAGRGR